MKTLIKCFLMSAIFGVLSVSADMGSISFKPKVKIFEPKQRAFIAWNGTEQILILSTDLRASAPTKVLEVIPLPAEPKVSEGDIKIFKKAVDLINEKTKPIEMETLSLDSDDFLSAESKPPPAKVTFHEKIGAHEISTIKLINEKGFIKWVEKHLASLGVENPEIPEKLRKVIKEYIDEGYTWFVFDVVELTRRPKTKQAIQFKFKTNYLYYPLKITKTETGKTSVEMLILTERLLNKNMLVGEKKIKVMHTPVRLNKDEIKELNKDCFELLGKPAHCNLRIWKVTGNLQNFKKDIIIGYKGIVKKCHKKYPDEIMRMFLNAHDPNNQFLLILSDTGSARLYNAKTEDMKIIWDLGKVDKFKLAKMDFHEGKFRLIYKDDTFVTVTTDGKVKK
jgi:hypothetical protein